MRDPLRSGNNKINNDNSQKTKHYNNAANQSNNASKQNATYSNKSKNQPSNQIQLYQAFVNVNSYTNKNNNNITRKSSYQKFNNKNK